MTGRGQLRTLQIMCAVLVGGLANSAGAVAAPRMEEADGSNTGSRAGGVARTEPEPREGQTGPAGLSMLK